MNHKGHASTYIDQEGKKEVASSRLLFHYEEGFDRHQGPLEFVPTSEMLHKSSPSECTREKIT
jgi:hypothetical protein